MAKWAYKLYDPSYGTIRYSSNHGGTQVDYSNTEYGFMGGQSDGEYTVYVTLLDSSGDMFNPPITDHVSFTYQSSAGNQAVLEMDTKAAQEIAYRFTILM